MSNKKLLCLRKFHLTESPYVEFKHEGKRMEIDDILGIVAVMWYKDECSVHSRSGKQKSQILRRGTSDAMKKSCERIDLGEDLLLSLDNPSKTSTSS
ncbi:hypothetical protein CDAR_370981 [Caerostris darwini]|uniref:Uncharacterized protein n=1 Tax=Caerostris darwini TaxID=1538125 RepID=A0AAV4NBQ0_9ARAC|nr:hypothetical protein CDAR_370981 [Caerostris darwini]